ncbi:conserved hypothetical protein [Syntrophobacter sp. SbD1]|nr:conserved hypothetical protein [Syntrophobacter sp. SbD1]
MLAGCATQPQLTKIEAFPKVYQERPLSILVLPPMNESTAAEAKEYYNTTIAEPLSFDGYYIFPLEVVSDILKNEGLYDSETLLNVPPQKFKEYFGADAVLYIKILKWDTAYYVIGGNVTVSISFLLKSTTTGDDLWKREGTMVLNTSGSTGNVGGVPGLVALVLTTAIKTAMADYVPVAKLANRVAITALPCGKYNPKCGLDQKDLVFQIGNIKQ